MDGERSDTPVMAAFREWQAQYDCVLKADAGLDFEMANTELEAIEDRMANLPFHGPADVLALLAAQTRWGQIGDHEWRDNLPAEALAVIERALA